MSIKSDRWIHEMCRDTGLIDPYEANQVREVDGRKIISAGLSSFGYDIRLAKDGFKVFSSLGSLWIDPKDFDPASLVEPQLQTSVMGQGQFWLLPPHSYALGVTMETFTIPRDVLGICYGKSTYARCGL